MLILWIVTQALVRLVEPFWLEMLVDTHVSILNMRSGELAHDFV